MKVKVVGLLIIWCFLSIGGCFTIQLQEYCSEEFLMDTFVSIKVYGSDVEEMKETVKDAFMEMRRIADLTNRFPGYEFAADISQVYQINQAAGKEPVLIDKDIFDLLVRAKYYCDVSQGEFDITIGPVCDLWGFGLKQQKVPYPKELGQALTFVGNEGLVLDGTTQTAFLRKEGMSIDLGAIAKGYAVEQAAQVLLKQGIKRAIINAGGNVRVIGENLKGDSWKVGIQDPRQSGNLIGVLSLKDESAVTSGDYQRCFFEKGERYHHLLSAQTGYPASETISVTVVAHDSTEADALSTVLFLLGPEKGLEVVEDIAGVEALFVTKDKQILLSSGLLSKIEVNYGKEYVYDSRGQNPFVSYTPSYFKYLLSFLNNQS